MLVRGSRSSWPCALLGGFLPRYRCVQVYKQRVKHLLFEHQNEAAHRKTDGQIALKLSQEDHRSGEAELKADKRSQKVELKEMQLSHEDYLKALKQVRGCISVDE